MLSFNHTFGICGKELGVNTSLIYLFFFFLEVSYCFLNSELTASDIKVRVVLFHQLAVMPMRPVNGSLMLFQFSRQE